MKIAVCLPSFNEAKNIRDITQIIDKGLTDFIILYPSAQVEIVNFDSNSMDNTSGIFIETKTNNPKYSFPIKNRSGKGKNILEFCEYVVENNIDYCLTIDSDVISVIPDWVTKLLQPLIEDDIDYIAPVYERSRFEGSSTNHFAFPFIYALTANVIRQPIAGDFAFTHKIASAIAKNNIVKDESIQRYGIDILMTITAIGTGSKISQVDLGKKLHTPSFSKLEYMFPQIAASALLSINTLELPKQGTQELEEKSNILSNLQFPHKKTAQEMKENSLTKLRGIMGLNWIDSQSIAEYLAAASKENVHEGEMVHAWTNVFSNWINHFLMIDITSAIAKQAGEELLPFFVLRATNFWFWAETVETNEVEFAIRRQAEILRDKVETV